MKILFLCEFRLKCPFHSFYLAIDRSDCIVFYMGNKLFLPPNVTRTLNEAQDLSINRHEDEDKAREKAIDLTT